MARTKSYEGEGIVINFELRRCIHAAKCVGGLPAVFDANRRPWIEAGNASADEIVRVVEQCPSGALTYERTDGGPAEADGLHELAHERCRRACFEQSICK